MEKELKELLREVLSLHGIVQDGYDNGLMERGVIYSETDSRTVYVNYVRQDMMNDIDEKIQNFIDRE